NTETPAQPVFTGTTSVDFGSVDVGTNTTRTVTVMNTGTAPFHFTSCSIAPCSSGVPDDSADFMVTGCPSGSLNPNSGATLSVTFAPSVCGPRTACLFLENGSVPQIVIPLTGVGTKAGQVSISLEGGGSSLSFGPVAASRKPRGDGPSHTFTIANT